MKEELKAGNCLKTKSGHFYFILKIIGKAYLQDAFDGKWSTQSNNEEKETIVYVWDGKFMNKKSLREIDMICEEILSPNDSDIFKTLERINNNYN